MNKIFFIAFLVLLVSGCGNLSINSFQNMPENNSQSQQNDEEFCNGPLVACEWKKVKIQAKIAKARGNHTLSPREPHTQVNYVDSNIDGQIVVYTKDKMDAQEGEMIEIVGTVAKIEKLGSDSIGIEHQIYADSWKVVNE